MSVNAMLIRCLQQRPGGTTVKMADGGLIKFTPDENGDHVAMVSNPAYIQRLLSIPEGYVIHSMSAFGVQEGEHQKPQQSAVVANVQTPAPTEPAVVREAQKADAADPADLSTLDDDHIRAVYRAELKREPHHKAKRETMIAQIEALREKNKA